MNANKETMLRRLQAADFVLHETVLYLDGHPTNQKALEFFRKAKTAYDELLAEFQQAFGPQTAYAADGSSPWEWVQALAVANEHAGTAEGGNAYVGL